MCQCVGNGNGKGEREREREGGGGGGGRGGGGGGRGGAMTGHKQFEKKRASIHETDLREVLSCLDGTHRFLTRGRNTDKGTDVEQSERIRGR